MSRLVNLTRYPLLVIDPATNEETRLPIAKRPAEIDSRWSSAERVDGVGTVLSGETWVSGTEDDEKIPDPVDGTYYIVDRYDGVETNRDDVLVPTRLVWTGRGMRVEAFARPW